jgi:2-polyprenyl-3-methyl-5-hydroxy-6-metoxy-1,4-benzoquinol methylase
MQGQLVEAEHMARYWWATNFSAGKRILDAGCGTGYGSAMLHDAGAVGVTAVDISEPVIEVARQTSPAGIRYESADLASLPFPNASFDLVVCFETIEHVEDRDAVLDELLRVMSPDALLLISSPNRNRYVPGNPHHKHEYVPSELHAALASRFPAVTMYSQHAMLASVITPTQGGFTFSTRRLVESTKDDEIYTIAVAGAHIPTSISATVALTQFLELRKWLSHERDQRLFIERQTDALRLADEQEKDRLEALHRLADIESEAVALHERIAVTDRDIKTVKQELYSATTDAADLSERLSRAETTMESMATSLSWRITKPLRVAKQIVKQSVRR